MTPISRLAGSGVLMPAPNDRPRRQAFGLVLTTISDAGDDGRARSPLTTPKIRPLTSASGRESSWAMFTWVVFSTQSALSTFSHTTERSRCIALFEAIERDKLKPLPAAPFVVGQWLVARVNIDYHVAVDGHFYSVPYRLVHRRLDVFLTATAVAIFHQGERVASHPRSAAKAHHTTTSEHMPPAHQSRRAGVGIDRSPRRAGAGRSDDRILPPARPRGGREESCISRRGRTAPPGDVIVA
jgi:hypothetical protein